MIYIASPYSHPNPGVRQERYLLVRLYTARLLAAKSWCYSPIVHCHDLANAHDLPTDAAYWLEYDFHVLERCDALHVLSLPGWEDSKGVQAEIAHWRALGGVPKLVSLEGIEDVNFTTPTGLLRNELPRI